MVGATGFRPERQRGEEMAGRLDSGPSDKGEKRWSGRLDSNQRPLRPERSALPDCATPRGPLERASMPAPATSASRERARASGRRGDLRAFLQVRRVESADAPAGGPGAEERARATHAVRSVPGSLAPRGSGRARDRLRRWRWPGSVPGSWCGTRAPSWPRSLLLALAAAACPRAPRSAGSAAHDRSLHRAAAARRRSGARGVPGRGARLRRRRGLRRSRWTDDARLHARSISRGCAGSHDRLARCRACAACRASSDVTSFRYEAGERLDRGAAASSRRSRASPRRSRRCASARSPTRSTDAPSSPRTAAPRR